ncbi:hypothetical protein [Xanthomonas translucens]|nr:hypothetical protein [Xanthomonas translucens]MCT8281770.1 hypothetical protein [Xanthomonas translucens pv. undulosa]UKE38284.1 hypothetical protein KCU58_10950 [Xanthomonas translucens pv. undulosa]
MVNYHVLQAAVDAVYLCAMCAEDGTVSIGMTRDPLQRVAKSRPHPVAAQWALVGSAARGKAIERRLRKEWASRHRAGEGFRFDYATEGAAFRGGLNAAFEACVGKPAEWSKVAGEELAELIRAQAEEDRRRLRLRPRIR